MGHSNLEYYLHLVWATYQREPLLTGETEAMIYACIRAEARHMHCDILALGGIADHVHLAVQPPSTLSPAQIAQQIKGAASRSANSKGIAFKWQTGYGGFSLSRPHLKAVIPYIRNQKRHHADNTLWLDWEPPTD
ncbi:MAG: IS200/IS605 family transposase [Janthinobacterium lividum]